MQAPDASILWFGVILATICFLVALIPARPNDFWWHLKIGEVIYEQRSIPTTNLFAWTLSDTTPFHYAAWLAELLTYVLHRAGGLELVVFARNIFFLAALWLIGYEARLRSGSWRWAALAILLIYAMGLNNLTLRPQNWSWLPFAVFWVILSRYTANKLHPAWLLILPPILAFWTNVHGSFVLGLGLISLVFLGEALRTLLRMPGARSWQEHAWLASSGMLAGLATLLNPRFIGIIPYVINLMTNRSSQMLIAEWQSPTLEGIPNTIFFASILACLISIPYSFHRLTPTELLLLVAFLWLAWSGQRHIIWYGLVCMPILTQLLSYLPLPQPRLATTPSWLNIFLFAILFIPVVLAQPWFVEDLPLPKTYWDQVIRDSPEGPLIAVDTPVAAIAYLRQHPGGNLFHEMGYGSYLIWALPAQGVFVDPRIELYPYQQWEDYIQISNAVNYNTLLTEYGANRLLLDRNLQPELATALTIDPAWQLEYRDAHAEIWIKTAEREASPP
ncbi:MAG: hypothetical protein JW726_07265 [Anaerolineales bacterium]|nr:hypothetical protein [Anaerolineales bacterium]